MVNIDNLILGKLRKSAKEKKLRFSKHANDRMGERRISAEEVRETIQYGDIIESQNHGWDTKYLFQEFRNEKSEIYVVLADAPGYPVVVTVCRTKEEVWEDINGLLTRKK